MDPWLVEGAMMQRVGFPRAPRLCIGAIKFPATELLSFLLPGGATVGIRQKIVCALTLIVGDTGFQSAFSTTLIHF